MNQELDLPPQLTENQRVGGFQVTRFVGRGGMAEVYEAQDLTLGRRVAVKVPRQDVQGRHQKPRFLNEARKAALIDHQNVITIFAAGEEDGLLYLVMQYVDGQDLSALLRSYGKALPWFLALKVARLAARGLYAVHQQGLVHRDIKPANIMLSSDSSVFVMDFGLVRDDASDLTSPGDLLGTPPFMSPEQCRGERVDHRSDIYSLGATLYCLISGRRPFDGTVLQVVRRVAKGSRPRPIRELVPEVPKDVAALIDKAMAVRRTNRFADAREMAKTISRLLKTHQTADAESWDTVSMSDAFSETHGDLRSSLVADVAPLQPAIDLVPDSRRQWWIGGVLLLLAVVCLGVIAFLQSDTRAPIAKPSDYPGMTYVPGGMVTLGNEERELRRFLGTFSLRAGTVDSVVSVCIESPTTPVSVDAFWIDQYEVTNAEYANFVAATGHRAPSHWTGQSPPFGKEDHPVVNVTYGDAQSYADWLGKRIPTREQWTRAFRADHADRFPWGDNYDPKRANVNDAPRSENGTIPVTATPRDVSEFKVYNLAGNVMEFVRGTFYRGNAPYRIVKGGSFKALGYVYGLAPMFLRYGMDYSDDDTGFRCVIDAKPNPDS